MGKYEGKLNFAQLNSERVAASERRAGARLFCGSAVPFILAAKSFKKCSHLIHNCSLSALPAGLRVETAVKIDKKKLNFIFHHAKKIS
jgi:Na+-transporting methylmalonyl-CoA/oxaloacetate decarboxylase beta subunit